MDGAGKALDDSTCSEEEVASFIHPPSKDLLEMLKGGKRRSPVAAAGPKGRKDPLVVQKSISKRLTAFEGGDENSAIQANTDRREAMRKATKQRSFAEPAPQQAPRSARSAGRAPLVATAVSPRRREVGTPRSGQRPGSEVGGHSPPPSCSFQEPPLRQRPAVEASVVYQPQTPVVQGRVSSRTRSGSATMPVATPVARPQAQAPRSDSMSRGRMPRPQRMDSAHDPGALRAQIGGVVARVPSHDAAVCKEARYLPQYGAGDPSNVLDDDTMAPQTAAAASFVARSSGGHSFAQSQSRPGSRTRSSCNVFWKPPPEAAALCEQEKSPSFLLYARREGSIDGVFAEPELQSSQVAAVCNALLPPSPKVRPRGQTASPSARHHGGSIRGPPPRQHHSFVPPTRRLI